MPVHNFELAFLDEGEDCLSQLLNEIGKTFVKQISHLNFLAHGK